MKATSNKSTFAKLENNGFISFDINVNAKKILIVGNTTGFFGYYREGNRQMEIDADITNVEYMGSRITWLYDILSNGAEITIIGNSETIEYYQKVFMFFKETCPTFNRKKQIAMKEINDDKECFQFINKMNEKNMSYDYIIQNPPYKGSLHLDFLNAGFDMLDKENGKMTIIEPATWLINVRKNGKAKTEYAAIKEMLQGHVSKVVIENCNKEFNIGLYVPCSITYVDMNKTFDEIEYVCCGYTQKVKSMYDCNLVGSYDMIWSIMNKVQKYGDMMKSHIYKADGRSKSVVDENTWYTKYADIIGQGGLNLSGNNQGSNVDFIFNCETYWRELMCGDYMMQFVMPSYHTPNNEITKQPQYAKKAGASKEFSKNLAANLYDTKEHLENWKHFVFNNKLPLFLNICLTIDQHNNSKEFIPWLVDKKYTDDEINKLFGFTDDEIAFMDKTLKKFERHSPWFKRYMCGKDSVSDSTVQSFVESL